MTHVLEVGFLWTYNELAHGKHGSLSQGPDCAYRTEIGVARVASWACRWTRGGRFIVQNPAGALQVIRWPRGAGNAIEVPLHRGCRVEGLEIIASFHTHPNAGPDYAQEPSETDRRAVQDDPDLKAPHYVGELVISATRLYVVRPSGHIIEFGETDRVLT